MFLVSVIDSPGTVNQPIYYRFYYACISLCVTKIKKWSRRLLVLIQNVFICIKNSPRVLCEATDEVKKVTKLFREYREKLFVQLFEQSSVVISLSALFSNESKFESKPL